MNRSNTSEKKRNLEVLILDDEPIKNHIANVVNEHRNGKYDYSFSQAMSIDEMRKILQRRSDEIDLLVLDIRLGTHDGRRFLEYLRSHEKWGLIPMIFLTGYYSDYSDKLPEKLYDGIAQKGMAHEKSLVELIETLVETGIKRREKTKKEGVEHVKLKQQEIEGIAKDRLIDLYAASLGKMKFPWDERIEPVIAEHSRHLAILSIKYSESQGLPLPLKKTLIKASLLHDCGTSNPTNRKIVENIEMSDIDSVYGYFGNIFQRPFGHSIYGYHQLSKHFIKEASTEVDKRIAFEIAQVLNYALSHHIWDNQNFLRFDETTMLYTKLAKDSTVRGTRNDEYQKIFRMLDTFSLIVVMRGKTEEEAMKYLRILAGKKIDQSLIDGFSPKIYRIKDEDRKKFEQYEHKLLTEGIL